MISIRTFASVYPMHMAEPGL